MKETILLLLLTILTCACTVGPNYHRPKVDAPATYRGGAPSPESSQPGASPSGPPAGASLGDEKWWDVFQDPQLQELIRTALKQNLDVQIAAVRILEAQAQLGITRADQLPSVNAGGAAVNQRTARQKPLP